MKSNLFKKATALGVAASMLLSTTAFATTTAPTMTDQSDVTKSSSASGSGSLVSPVYKVKVPTSFSFLVDPFELSPLATGSALNPRSAIKVPGYGYAISNQSNIAVTVDVEATLATVANVFVVPSNGAVNTYTTATDSSLAGFTSSQGAVVLDPNNKDKEISLFMLIAKTGSLATSTALFAQPKTATYAKEGAVEVNFAGNTEKPARATFLLDKGIVGTDGKPKLPAELNPAATAAGIFSFQGDINQYAPWAASDIKIAVKYTFAPVPEAKKAELIASPNYDGQRQSVLGGTAGSSEVEIVPPVSPFFTTDPEFTKSTGTTTPLDLAVNVGDGFRKLSMATGTTAVTGKVGTVVLAAADFNTADLSALKITSTGLTKIKVLAEGKYPFEFTAKNGRTLKGTFEIKD